MSQRDTFAREAMSGILSNDKYCLAVQQRIVGKGGLDLFASEVAADSYLIADAMLKERERTNKSKAQKELEK